MKYILEDRRRRKKYMHIGLVVGVILLLTLSFFVYKKVSNSQSSIKTTSISKKEEVPTVKLSFAGDLLMHSAERKSGYNGSNNSYNFNGFFSDIKQYFGNKDYVIGSFETPVKKEKSENLYSGYPAFKNPPEFLEAIKNAGINVLVTANNHCLDQGLKGALETMDWIEKYNIPYTGTFKSQQDRQTEPVLFLEKNNIKIALVNYAEMSNMGIPNNYIMNTININNIKKDINFAKRSNADVVIVWLHFGNEYQRIPSENQKKVVNEIANMGVDIIVGSHPHVIQPMEMLNVNGKNVLVAYSLGNFISNQYWRYSTDGMILNVDISKINNKIELKNINYIPTAVVREYKGPEVKNEPAIKIGDNASDFITGAISRGTLKGNEVKFRILSASEGLYNYKNKLDKGLNDKDYIRLKTTWDDTTSLIGEGSFFKVYRDIKNQGLPLGQKK